jgi:hypothetical protein
VAHVQDRQACGRIAAQGLKQLVHLDRRQGRRRLVEDEHAVGGVVQVLHRADDRDARAVSGAQRHQRRLGRRGDPPLLEKLGGAGVQRLPVDAPPG